MTKGKSLAIISLLIAIILLINVSAEETTQNVDGFDFFSWVSHIFGLGEFSVVGDYRQCGPNPSYERLFAFGASMHVSANSYCSSGYGLINVFDGNWNTIGEWKNSIALACGDRDGCRVQVYCCPHDECTSDSQCVNWYGSGSNCVSRSANDPNINYYDQNYQQLSSFRYCTQPSNNQLTCWYYPGSGNSCLSRTYWESSCPSSYMGNTLYTSKSTCENNACTQTNNKICYQGDSWWVDTCGNPDTKSQDCTDLGLICQNGQCKSQTANCVNGAEDCLDGTKYLLCENGNWVNKGNVVGKCGVTEDNGNGGGLTCVSKGGECDSDGKISCGSGKINIGTYDCSNLNNLWLGACCKSEGTNNETQIPPSKAITLTWAEYYSKSDLSIIDDGAVCLTNSDCESKEGYNVVCKINQDTKKRIWDGQKDWCKERSWSGHGLLGGLIGGIVNILIDPCAYYSDLASFFNKVYNGQDSGICIAESKTWYGKLWDNTLKTVGSLGIPASFVLIVTILFIIIILSFIPKIL